VRDDVLIINDSPDGPAPDVHARANTGLRAQMSPARLVFTTGLVLSLFLALIGFLDHNTTNTAIFGVLSIAFCLMLLRSKRRSGAAKS
jgi:hypothetical protein